MAGMTLYLWENMLLVPIGKTKKQVAFSEGVGTWGSGRTPQLWCADAPAAGASCVCPPHPSKLAACVSLVTGAQEEGGGREVGHSGHLAGRQLVLGRRLPSLAWQVLLTREISSFPFLHIYSPFGEIIQSQLSSLFLLLILALFPPGCPYHSSFLCLFPEHLLLN